MAKTRKDGSDEHEIGKLSRNKGGSMSWAQAHWHALGARPYPLASRDFDGAIADVIREVVLPGSLPDTPPLSPEDEILTFGSCFARELRDYLLRAGVESRSVWIPEGLNNSYAILDFVSWCVTGAETGRGYAYGRGEDAKIAHWRPPRISREECLNAFRGAGAFVFTLGLAEVWEDKETRRVFWQGVPESIFDGDRHVFRLSSTAENESNILEIVRLVRTVNDAAPIVLTLSPIPLRATFREVSCVVADCVSKSVLRVAIDLVVARGLPGLYYWPSFEVVRWVGSHRSSSAYPKEARRVHGEIVEAIIEAFVDTFYVTPPPVPEHTDVDRSPPSRAKA